MHAGACHGRGGITRRAKFQKAQESRQIAINKSRDHTTFPVATPKKAATHAEDLQESQN